jgi:thioredoxin reductase
MAGSRETSRSLRIAILGAGPIGLEAALYGRMLGHDVVIFEQGDIAQAVQSWRHVRMFSPWSMNRSALGQRRVAEAGYPAPDPSHCPTGGEFADHYLLPLSRDPLLEGRLRLHSRIVEIGRAGLLKGDLIGQAGRTRYPFRLLLDNRTGEHVEHADVVIDSSGTYSCPNAIGDGGIAAPGERWLGDRLVRHIPDVHGKDRGRFAGRRVLVVGSGYSAATTVVALAQLCQEAPQTEVLWAVRKEGPRPYDAIEGDTLPVREALIRAANDLARAGLSPAGAVRFLPGTVVDALSAEGHRLRVTLRHGDHWHEELCDEVVGLTGYGPDHTIYQELQIHECYASRGPMKLAASLLAAGGGGDCLAQPEMGHETLRNPEPRFFIIGNKSYGRNSTFLLRHGHGQVRSVYALLHEDADLDLYEEKAAAQSAA